MLRVIEAVPTLLESPPSVALEYNKTVWLFQTASKVVSEEKVETTMYEK